MVFVLGNFFTMDIVWHLDEQPGNKRFNKAWGFSPGLTSAITGFKIGGKRWALTGIVLSLVACFALVKDIWLFQSIKIQPYRSIGELQNFTVATVKGGFDVFNQLARPQYLSFFATEVIIGLKDATVLHLDDDGTYIWSPWLIDPAAEEIVIEDYLAFGLRPKCTLLKGSQVAVTYLGQDIAIDMPDVRIDISADVFNTSEEATLYMTSIRPKSSWNTTSVRSNSSELTTSDYVVSFHVFGTPSAIDNGTHYTFDSSTSKFVEIASGYSSFNAYVYGCRIDIRQYNITGQVVSKPSQSLDRLNLTSKVLVTEPNDETDHVVDMVTLSAIGFSEGYQLFPDTFTEICKPIECWMLDSIPGVDTGYNSSSDGPTTTLLLNNGWIAMTPALLEYKIIQSIGYVLSPSAATNVEILMARNVTNIFITETIQKNIFGGVAVELLLIVLAIVFYFASVSDFARGHGDDLDYLTELLAPREDESELEHLKG